MSTRSPRMNLGSRQPAGDGSCLLGGRAGGCGGSLVFSGNPDVVVLPGELPFLLSQVRFPDRDDEAPVLTDRTALDPGHDQVQFLDFDAGNPDGREQVTLTAPHDGIGAEVIAETSSNKSCPRDNADDDQNGFDGSPQHSVIMSPLCRPGRFAGPGARGWSGVARNVLSNTWLLLGSLRG
jgi:hypothetical protein